MKTASSRRTCSTKKKGISILPPTSHRTAMTASERNSWESMVPKIIRQALERGTLEGSTELGGNHCGSLQKNFKLQPGEEARFVIMLGEGNREEVRRIRVKYSDLKRVDAVYTDLAAYWKQKYAALRSRHPTKV